MQCIQCKYPESKVVRTTTLDWDSVVRRRRECVKCGNRFTTLEKLREPSRGQENYQK